jgi:hypothetical protein
MQRNIAAKTGNKPSHSCLSQNVPEESMSVIIHAHAVQIEVSDASRLQESLSNAVNNLIHIAAENKCGILITRHNYRSYVAAVDPKVPFGETREISQ